MMTLYTFNCVSCSAPLQVKDGVGFFSCTRCGTQHVLERSNGAIMHKAATDSITMVKSGADLTFAELATKRIADEQQALLRQRQTLVLNINRGARAEAFGGCFDIIYAFIAAIGVLIVSGFIYYKTSTGNYGIVAAILCPIVTFIFLSIYWLKKTVNKTIIYRKGRQKEVDQLDMELANTLTIITNTYE